MRLWWIVIALIAADQGSKWLVRSTMTLGESWPIVPSVLHLTYIENPGAAFGILSGNATLLLLVTAVILVALICFFYRSRQKHVTLEIGTALVVSGAIGNALDRMQKGTVTDMFDLRIWPIFNVADIAVCIGFVLLAYFVVRIMEE